MHTFLTYIHIHKQQGVRGGVCVCVCVCVCMCWGENLQVH